MMVAALLTRHGKGPLLAAALRGQGIGVVSIEHWDTDRLGTFSGEIERPAPAPEVVRLKAILAADLSGCGLGLGSEGCFGGGPYPGLLPWQQELVACLIATPASVSLVLPAGQRHSVHSRWPMSRPWLSCSAATLVRAGYYVPATLPIKD